MAIADAWQVPRTQIESTLCEFARTTQDAAELALIAEGSVYATNTRVADCLLQNPAVRSREDVLRYLATMIDVNHDPGLQSSNAPTIAEIRRRAEELR
jgi:hypothetical protein